MGDTVIRRFTRSSRPYTADAAVVEHKRLIRRTCVVLPWYEMYSLLAQVEKDVSASCWLKMNWYIELRWHYVRDQVTLQRIYSNKCCQLPWIRSNPFPICRQCQSLYQEHNHIEPSKQKSENGFQIQSDEIFRSNGQRKVIIINISSQSETPTMHLN